jgi:hypothetical protein
MVSKESESYRRQMLRHFKEINDGPPPTEVSEAEKVVMKFREEQTQAREAIPRLSAPLPEPNLCPKCWFLSGKCSFLVGIPHPTNPAEYDFLKCRSCTYVEERDA